VIDLNDYRVSADEPSADAPIVALVCGICSQHGKPSDVRWYEPGYSPTIPQLVADAEQHETNGHQP
jgi:hypothetical protein